jgi:hypothetical protein
MYFVLSVLAMSCNTTTSLPKASQAINESGKAKPDMAKIKAEIQALNTTWANAVNTEDAATIGHF